MHLIVVVVVNWVENETKTENDVADGKYNEKMRSGTESFIDKEDNNDDYVGKSGEGAERDEE